VLANFILTQLLFTRPKECCTGPVHGFQMLNHYLILVGFPMFGV